MSEFKTIPIAPKYEIDKEGSIQTVDKKSPIFPYPMGSQKVRLNTNEGKRQEFNIKDLVDRVFNETVVVVDFDVFPIESGIGVKSNKGNNKGDYTPNYCTANPDAEMETKIMALDTFTSVKIWKLHEAGIKEDRIRELVGPKNQANVANTIKNFKKSETLRAKSDKVKI